MSTSPLLSASRKLAARRISKGKGKQRDHGDTLNDDEEDDGDNDGHGDGTGVASGTANGDTSGRRPDNGMSVTVRFTTGESDLDVWIEDNETVGRVKDKIRSLRPLLPSSLRLIHSGRLLTNGILLLPWLQSLHSKQAKQAKRANGMVVDVGEVLRDVGLTDGFEEEEEREEKVWIHCVVGGKDGEGDDQVGDAQPPLPQPALRGFDTLLSAGLSPLEIAQMRQQFYASRGEQVPEGLEGVGGGGGAGAGQPGEEEHARALEELWIEGEVSGDTAVTSGEGIYMSTLLGLITGFLFPLLPFSLFREPPSPDFFHPLVEEPVAGGVAEGPFRLRGRQSGDWVVGVAFGPRMQGAIFLGTVLNLAFGALRFLG